ncbi:MAG: DUF2061 domain-containing protein [Proteobacteria bacterium]|nr:DUF2061 domain-containing protein [Pseudomonadota bacterium]
MASHSQNRRSLVKAATFRLLVFCSDLTVVFLITHRWDTATGLVVATNFASTTLYFFHERIWDRIQWGRAAASYVHVELVQALLGKK